LNILQFAVGLGANAYVTSGDEAKIEKAQQLGAKGGVNYKTDGWEKELKKQFPKNRPYIDAIIDGAGGNVISKATKLLKVCVSSSWYFVLKLMPTAGWCCRSIWNDGCAEDGVDYECRS
jgi:NADPH:quinone reductase-like Zn-dependent oxidoreductase